MSHAPFQSPTVQEGLEARLGVRLASVLTEGADTLPHDVTERLRHAREQALARARSAQAAVARPVVAVSAGGAAVLGGGQGWWVRVASLVPLAVLVAGLVLIQQWSNLEEVMAAAEIDAVLLADELPPDAWADPGFREYLKAPPP